MKPSAAQLLPLLARLTADPVLIRPDCAHRIGHMAQRLTRADMGDGMDNEPDDDECPPWETREAIQYLPGGVAVVPAKGMLMAGIDDPFIAWVFDICRPEALQAACAELSGRTDVRLVIFDIDSPGGYTTAIPETATIVAQLSARKTTVAFTAGMMCSAAYWLGSQCEKIVATPSATLGSVGTYTTIYDFSKMFADAGIITHVIKAGTLKAIGVQGAPVTDDQLAFLQGNVDSINKKFVAAVRAGRGTLADEDLQGQWFDGDQAVEKNLADATALTRSELLNAILTPSLDSFSG